MITFFKIIGFPTLKFFTKATGPDAPLSYEGPRTSADIVSYVIKKTGAASNEIKTVEELNTIIAGLEDGPVAIFFGTSEDDKDYPTYESVANELEGISFHHTYAPELREE